MNRQLAQKTSAEPKQIIPHDKNRQVFYGNLHIHTGLSRDAYIIRVRSEPADVYNIVKGNVINIGAGYPI
ncbi:MAG: hypothetical protein ACJAYG_002498 [Oceanicoccus sp.]|jgi:hypothetical protein